MAEEWKHNPMTSCIRFSIFFETTPTGNFQGGRIVVQTRRLRLLGADRSHSVTRIRAPEPLRAGSVILAVSGHRHRLRNDRHMSSARDAVVERVT